MKIYLCIASILISLTSCGQFHIKVETCGCTYDQIGYVAKATNNNWLTSTYLNDVIDLTMDGGEVYEGGVWVDIDPKIFINDRSGAIQFAKKFTSYQQCLDYNKNVTDIYNAKIAYYKKHPPHIVKQKPPISCKHLFIHV